MTPRADAPLLLNVLGSDLLEVGENRISSLDRFPDFGFPASVFVGRVALLRSTCQEVYVVDRRPSPPPIDEIDSEKAYAATELARLAGVTDVWIVSNAFTRLRTAQVGNVRIHQARHSEVLSVLMSVPEMADEAYCARAGTDIAYLKAVYRQRIATAFLFDNKQGTLRRGEADKLDEILLGWSRRRDSQNPILLIGERGSGKTWQLLRYCLDQNGRHRENPELEPPAIYVSLRGLSSEWASHRAVDLFSLITRQHRWLTVKWNATMFATLVREGLVVLCLDGLDEIQQQPSRLDVQEHLVELFRLLPPGARFVLSSRTTHFDSFASLAFARTWPGSIIGTSAQVLELQPFDNDDIRSYVARIGAINAHGTSPAGSLLKRKTLVARAIALCARQPGLLAHLQEVDRDTSELSALQEIMEGALISFNLDAERTRAIHRDSQGSLHRFDNVRRSDLLGELAWFMGERGLAEMDLAKLPVRLSLLFGVDSDALRRDIRSQTVFELVDSPKGEPRVRFGIRYRPELGVAGRGSEAAVETTSVAQDYFLSRHIHRRLTEGFGSKAMGSAEALRFVGSVPLSPLCASVLAAMLDAGVAATRPRRLAQLARAWIVRSARRASYEIFAAPYRHLVANLERMGCLSHTDAQRLDPWRAGSAVTRLAREGGKSLPYEMAVVPPCSSSKIQGWSQAIRGIGVDRAEGRPFLLGVHEVTNEHFLAFVTSPEGADWTVERVTRAGSADGRPSSPFAEFTNEYHLYYWEKNHEGAFRPLGKHLRYPVVYVSWYAAQAYCDWLSGGDGRCSPSTLDVTRATDSALSDDDAPGFRLPSACEWRWAAQGTYATAAYPWELVPYPTNRPPAAPLAEYRRAVRDVLLDRSYRSGEVAYDDEFSVFGVSGLVGNVKEWVQDFANDTKVKKGRPEGVVLGSTAHLSEASFRFDYYATLYPENTNPDVGFRIARSLSRRELGSLSNRQKEIASISL